MEERLILDKNNYITYKNIKNGTDYNFDLVYFHGFYSNMESKKCKFFENFCRENGIHFIALNYLGHGTSSGKVEDFTTTDWLENIKNVIDKCSKKNLIFLGSSMGSWLSFLTALNYEKRVKGIIGVSSAIDYLTESVEPNVKKEDFEKEIILKTPDKEGNFNNNITRKLWLDGKQYNLLTKEEIALECPIRLIHGMCDNLIDYKIPLKFIEKVKSKNAKITLIKDADHYMKRQSDLDVIVNNLVEIVNILI